ncbi:MAG: hypothetical protein AB7D37_16015 [Desulfovibrio sp.]
MRRLRLYRGISSILVLVAALSLVFDASRLLTLTGLFTGNAEARPGGGGGPHFGGGGGPRMGGGAPRMGGGAPRMGGAPGGLRFGGGAPMAPRTSVRPPAGRPGGPGFAPMPGPVPVAPGFGPGPRGPVAGPVPGPRPVPGPGWGPRPVGPVPVPVPGPGWGPRPPMGPGPWLWTLPAAAVALTVAGMTYYNYNNTCYVEQFNGDRVVYVPVKGPCPPR